MLSNGTRIGSYQIESLLGAGGMGEVYLAEDTRLGRKVALKTLTFEFSRDPDRLRRFEQEARAASALSSPNAAHIYDIGESGGLRFIAMEYVDGETLQQKIDGRPMTAAEIVEIALQITDALDEAHSKGIVHRDLKPANIKLSSRGRVKVLDFGLARLARSGDGQASSASTEAQTTPGTVMGTFRYMSPEQALGREVDQRSDIFSLGIVLYEMATGRTPFASGSTPEIVDRIVHEQPEAIARFNYDIPAELERIIRKCLEKERERRYQSSRELLVDLNNFKRDSILGHILSASRPAITRPSAVPLRRRLLLAAVALAILLPAGGTAFYLYRRHAGIEWARSSVARVEELARAERYDEAFDLASAIEAYLPKDPTIARLKPTIDEEVSIASDPPGAAVYLRQFKTGGSTSPKQPIGTTPIEHRIVRRGDYIVSVEKEGYATLERTISGGLFRFGGEVIMTPEVRAVIRLVESQKMPARMTFVPGGNYRLVSWGRPGDAAFQLDDYFIDKFEVTNHEFKEFIDAGGYLKKDYWKGPFVKNGRALAWEDAIAMLRDRTGMPGPRDWSNQTFPEGKADYPVSGVTWYEASAYARFREKSLPTIFQWEKAARDGMTTPSSFVVMPWGAVDIKGSLDQRANFRGNGTMPVSSLEFGMSPYGCYHMAGNAAEWCANATSDGFVTAGASWQEPAYVFSSYGSYPGFYSSDRVGFRCARSSPGSGDQGAMTFNTNKPAPTYQASSEAEFQSLLTHYRYDRGPLQPEILEVQETSEWRREKIAFAGAGGERAFAYLFLPNHYARPLEVVHFTAPADVVQGVRSIADSIPIVLGAVVRSGRAVLGVVLKGNVERPWPPDRKPPQFGSVKQRDELIQAVTDCRRALEYIDTRKDLDAGKIALVGASAGIYPGLVLPAVEPRYRSLMLSGSGARKIWLSALPEANALNFAPHIKIPKLMLSGRYDENFVFKTEIEPLYRLLRDPKRIEVYEGGHAPPYELFALTITRWLDETLGPVRR